MASSQLAHRRREYNLLLQTTISVAIIIMLGHGTKNKHLKPSDEPQNYRTLLAFLPYIRHHTQILMFRRTAANYRHHADGVVD
jgi:hypothetical protein